MCSKISLRKTYLLVGTAVAAVTAVSIVKLIQHRHCMGFAEKAGRGIDLSIKTAAHYLEKASDVLGVASQEGFARTLGKGVDEALYEAKTAINKVTILVQNTLKK